MSDNIGGYVRKKYFLFENTITTREMSFTVRDDTGYLHYIGSRSSGQVKVHRLKINGKM